ncbi:MAG: vitamin K epoxide reductase family protein, partial [Pyrinomonadaceae bacterium]
VLTSVYAEIGGIPLAAFGAAAYFLAFSFALLSLYGNKITWKLFGSQVVVMALFTGWLLYVQAYLIHAFCQFCLLSALTTFSMLIVFLISLFIGRSRPALT